MCAAGALGRCTTVRVLQLPKMPVLFGLLRIFEVLAGLINLVLKGTPSMRLPGSHPHGAGLLFTDLLFADHGRCPPDGFSGQCSRTFSAAVPLIVSASAQLLLLYVAFYYWADMNEYRLVTLRIMMIAVLFTLSLNIINGYMGEFSCSHPGFMAIGAYMSSVFTVGLFVNDKVLGEAVVSWAFAWLSFPVALLIGGWQPLWEH
jgi:branched-chain amino acid transport system permease protein